MKLRRREWLIICGLALAAIGLERGSRAFGGETGMRGLKPGAEEYLRARSEAQQARSRRQIDRSKILEQPDVRAAWVQLAHDRFTASPGSCELVVQAIGKGHVRGLVPQSVEDTSSGDLLRIAYGDYGDHYMEGSLRIGRDGDPLPLFITTIEEEGRSLFVVNAWLMTHNNLGNSKGLPFPSDKAMSVLARLFNCRDPRFHFVAMRGPPHILDRPKQRYGPNKIDLYVSDRNAFLDRFVDRYYDSLGLDPTLGHLDPDSIPRP